MMPCGRPTSRYAEANEATVLYNAACAFSTMSRRSRRWTRCARHGRRASATGLGATAPDLSALHGQPEFERLYPEQKPQTPA